MTRNQNQCPLFRCLQRSKHKSNHFLLFCLEIPHRCTCIMHLSSPRIRIRTDPCCLLRACAFRNNVSSSSSKVWENYTSFFVLFVFFCVTATTTTMVGRSVGWSVVAWSVVAVVRCVLHHLAYWSSARSLARLATFSSSSSSSIFKRATAVVAQIIIYTHTRHNNNSSSKQHDVNEWANKKSESLPPPLRYCTHCRCCMILDEISDSKNEICCRYFLFETSATRNAVGSHQLRLVHSSSSLLANVHNYIARADSFIASFIERTRCRLIIVIVIHFIAKSWWIIAHEGIYSK